MLHGDNNEANMVFEVDILEEVNDSLFAGNPLELLVFMKKEVIDEVKVEGVCNTIVLDFSIVVEVLLQDGYQRGVQLAYLFQVNDQFLAQLEVLEQGIEVLFRCPLHSLVAFVEILHIVHVEVFVTFAVDPVAGQFQLMDEESLPLLVDCSFVLRLVEVTQTSGQVFVLTDQFLHVVEDCLNFTFVLDIPWGRD